MFIKSIKFKNVKVLKNTVLPLGRFTLLIGPNGSGKTTAMRSLAAFRRGKWPWSGGFSVGLEGNPHEWEASMVLKWSSEPNEEWLDNITSSINRRRRLEHSRGTGGINPGHNESLNFWLQEIRFYSFDAVQIAMQSKLQAKVEMAESGTKLAVVLDRLRDDNPERFKSVNEAIKNWLPEFDSILFDVPTEGDRSISLRTRKGGHKISAGDLSQGTLIALALLTLAYLPEPPTLVLLEEPDRGLHPRLMHDVKDALYRLAFPEESGEDREPVQVVVTTHSPYFLDLFRDNPEQIVIAEKKGNEATFTRLVDRDDLDGLLDGESSLGDLWYSGVLGGVPTEK
ncbi:MAG: AAA family ATPase [Planctomycetes bacterium]|nr:AAA family ATPase [Planctomycetota bacterium]